MPRRTKFLVVRHQDTNLFRAFSQSAVIVTRSPWVPPPLDSISTPAYERNSLGSSGCPTPNPKSVFPFRLRRLPEIPRFCRLSHVNFRGPRSVCVSGLETSRAAGFLRLPERPGKSPLGMLLHPSKTRRNLQFTSLHSVPCSRRRSAESHPQVRLHPTSAGAIDRRSGHPGCTDR